MDESIQTKLTVSFDQRGRTTVVTPSAPEVGMKLSQAIRIGAKLRPQCTGLMFLHGESCALGAAYEAIFGYPDDVSIYAQSDLQDRLRAAVRLPNDAVRTIGTERNDRGESRESIADWLESIGY